MSTLTIPLDDEDLEFLRSWTRQQGTTPESFLADQAHNLRRHLQTPLHPAVLKASGVIDSEVDAKEEYLNHQERKHA